jgi:GNAT superfamily N-acetyltransferase
MNFVIRNAKIQEIGFILNSIKEILKIEKATPDKKKIDEQRKFIIESIKNKEIRIANKENNPIGFLWFKIGDITPFGLNYGKWERKYCWINWVYVLQKYRNQGMGSLLYQDLMKICKKRGVKEIMLDVFKVNKKSLNFHIEQGFKPLLSIFHKKIE